jgi:hypothetical protein
VLPNYVNGTYEYITTWTSKHYVQQWCYATFPTIKTNGSSIFVNQILVLLVTYLNTSTLDCFKNLCAIHSMMGVCSRFEIWRLLSQLLWTLGVAQHWRGCSFHKIKLPTFCPNHVFWLNSILQTMEPIERFKCCYLWIY